MDKAYLVLLNGLASANQLSENSRLRLDKLLSVWDEESYIILSTGYTRHKPPFLDSRGYPITESRAAATILLQIGIDRAKILVEELSSDTIGNFYFSMLLFAQPLGIRSLSIVTSSYHMPRAGAAARWICSLRGWHHIPDLTFESAVDAKMSDEFRELVRSKEASALLNIERVRRSVRCVDEMCLWLQRDHGAYSFDSRVDLLPPELLQLY